MQKYKTFAQYPHISSLTFQSSFSEGFKGSFYVILSKEWSKQQTDCKYLQTIYKYLSKNEDLQNDVKKDRIKLYTFNDEDPFSFCFIQTNKDPISDGATIIKNAQKHIPKMREEDLLKPMNQVTIILPQDYTVQMVVSFLYGLQVANYSFTESTCEIGGYVPTFTIQHIHLITSISQQQYDEEIQNNIQSKILYQSSKSLNLLKALVPLRPNKATTDFMKQYILDMAQSLGNQVEVKIVSGDQLLDKGLRLIHAVGRASKYEPFMCVLKYQGKQMDDKYLALIGKGIVYDSGGLSLKPTSSMMEMYEDKTGACTVLETFRAIVEMKLPINVVCGVAFAENSVGSDAYRNSDIIQSYKGLSVEIQNTDAEGRLILADTMSYVQDHFKVEEMIELSTLTGVMKSALGKMCGVFTNSEECWDKLQQAAKLSQEKFWILPLNNEHRGYINGNVSDLLNTSSGKVGASCAAAFLEHFVEKNVKWMHWDIANVVKGEKGVSGFGLLSILHYVTKGL